MRVTTTLPSPEMKTSALSDNYPYDDYAIEWGYRYFGQTPEEERTTLLAMVDEKSLDPMYMFGGRGNDPVHKQKTSAMTPLKRVVTALRI